MPSKKQTPTEKQAQRDYELGKGSGVSVESIRERNTRIEQERDNGSCWRPTAEQPTQTEG
jgi:hypothetical protein